MDFSKFQFKDLHPCRMLVKQETEVIRLRGRRCDCEQQGSLQSDFWLNSGLVLLHCQTNVKVPAHSGLTNPLHVYEYGLDMPIQAEQGVTYHNII